jgi:Pyridine nucleotide-disulphide oxidoreductase, dimerisation domain
MPVAAVVRLSEQLMATHPGEMISELTLAIFNKVPLEVLAETVHCHPTQAVVFQRVALEYAKTRKVPATS